MISDKEFRVLLDLFMVSDPWPLSEAGSNEVIEQMLARESQSRGFDGWVDAYHRHGRSVEIEIEVGPS